MISPRTIWPDYSGMCISQSPPPVLRGRVGWGPRTAPHLRAFVIWEMMMVIGLLSVVGLMASQLFRAASNASLNAAVQQEKEMRFEQMLRQLRSDVWTASSFKLLNDRSIQLQTSDSHTIEWSVDGSISRKGLPAEQRQWDAIGAQLHFQTRGPSLILEVDAKDQPPGELVLVSQHVLLTGSGK